MESCYAVPTPLVSQTTEGLTTVPIQFHTMQTDGVTEGLKIGTCMDLGHAERNTSYLLR